MGGGSDGNESQKESGALKTRTRVEAGGTEYQHNEALVRDRANCGLKVRTTASP